MIKERVITILRSSELKTPELEERTGVNRYTWQNIKNKPGRTLKTEEIEAVIGLFPQYALWIASGNIAPEIGQTSPEYDQANENLSKRAEG